MTRVAIRCKSTTISREQTSTPHGIPASSHTKKITLPDYLSINKYSKNEIRALQDINVVHWATDSRTYLPQVYKSGGNKINDDYVDACVPIIKNQILKARIRLAGVLNEVFKNYNLNK